GSIRSVSICTMTSVPPANTRAGPVAPASKATAACSVAGASYLRSVIKPPSLVSSLARSCLEFGGRPRPTTKTQDRPGFLRNSYPSWNPGNLALRDLLPNNEVGEYRGPLMSALENAVISRCHADETRSRIGLIIPSSNRMTEPQFHRYAPAGAAVHIA